MSKLLEMAVEIEACGGIYRNEAIDEFLQSLWSDDGDESLMVDVGNELHDKPAPFTDDLGCAMALAVRLLDDRPIDIEVAHRTVGKTRYGRAEICGPDDYATGQAKTPTLALLSATLRALHDRSARSNRGEEDANG